MGFSDRGYYRFDNSFQRQSDWTAVITLIIANVAVWVLNLFGGRDFSINNILALRGDLPEHLLECWKLISYGFAHDANSPWHLAFNMLAIFFSGGLSNRCLGKQSSFDSILLQLLCPDWHGFSVSIYSPVDFHPAGHI